VLLRYMRYGGTESADEALRSLAVAVLRKAACNVGGRGGHRMNFRSIARRGRRLGAMLSQRKKLSPHN
jgi:hypothetical protein